MQDSPLTQSIQLRCGLTLPNRLVKAATSESIAPSNKLPCAGHQNIYSQWSEGGWGMLITGNVQVDAEHLGTHSDLAVDADLSDETITEAWSAWAKACSKHGTPTVMQLNHPGRQSPIGAGKRGFFGKTIAPSAVPMDMGAGLLAHAIRSLAFGTPREMNVAEIETIPGHFARAARLASQSGFAGVEIHAAHGYLLSQFLSSASNRRVDAYGGSAAKRAKLTLDVTRAVRAAVPSDFCIGISVNAVNMHNAAEFKDCVDQLQLITDVGVDFIEITGGTFEKPSMFLGPIMSGESEKRGVGEAFFADFAEALHGQLKDPPPIVLTGGFRTFQAMTSAITRGDCDLIGLARPGVADPSLPKNKLLSRQNWDADHVLYTKKTEAPWILKVTGVKALCVHIDNAWYVRRMKEWSRSNHS